MLAEHKLKILQDLVNNASSQELAWMNNFISNQLLNSFGAQQPAAATQKFATNKVTIAYGSETGNSKRVATDFASKAKKAGLVPKLVSLDQYRLTDLPKEEYFLTVISTQGEGEPPESAKKFYDHIHNNGFKLDKLKYSVLALGDTSYPLFCKTGEDVDTQLQKLGGQRIEDIQKCDVEYDTDANQWFERVMKKLAIADGNATTVAPTAAPATDKKSTGKKAYTGTILTNINLNDRGSNKETWHIEIAADDVEYECGDSIGIVPENATLIVEKILSYAKGINAGKKIEYKKETYSIFELLKYKLNISHLITAVIKRYAAIVGVEIAETKADLLDLLKAYPVKDEAQFEEVLGILNPVAPRLYTLASSPAAHSGEVHVIVAKDIFTVNQEKKYGVCSAFLGIQKPNTELKFFVQKNKRFRLPAPEKDIIMIGPGTGIAPYRSFLAERDAVGATGKNWLFFGEQHFTTDFLYQTEMQNWFETGVLTKINLAFSRDQAEKIYVQHRMWEQGAELYNWIQSGAHIYLCGKKDPMSVDVEHAIMGIIEKFGEKTAEEAKEYFLQMQNEGRYSEDVY
ncbi:MAG: flavodoxin domain-containing protein [Chitinophagaceae bacterium]